MKFCQHDHSNNSSFPWYFLLGSIFEDEIRNFISGSKLRFSSDFERISSALRLIFNLVTLKNVGKFSGLTWQNSRKR